MNIDRETYLHWIDDYRAGTLDPAQRMAVEAYLDAHPEDRIELDREEALLDAFDRLPRPPAPADLRGSVMARLRAERAGGAGEVGAGEIDGMAAAAGTAAAADMAEVVEIGERKESGPRETPVARRKRRSGIYRMVQVAAVLVVCVSAWQLTRQSREQAETSARQKGISDATATARADQPRAEGADGARRGARESAGLAAVAEPEAPRQAGAEAKMKSSVPERKAKVAAGSREEGVAFDEVGRVELADGGRTKPLADGGRELAAGASKADAGVARGIAAPALDSAAEQPVNGPAARGRAVDSDKDVALGWDASPSVATEEDAPPGDERFALRSLAAQPASAPAAATKPRQTSETFGLYDKAAKASDPDVTAWFHRPSESAAPGAASAPVAVGDLAVAPAQPSVNAFGTVMMTPAPSNLKLQRVAPASRSVGAPKVSPDLSAEAPSAIRRDANEIQPPDDRRRVEERVSEQAWALGKEEQSSKAVSPSSPQVPTAAEAPREPAAAGSFLTAALPAPTPAPRLPKEAEAVGYSLRGDVGQLSPAASAPTGQTSSFDQKDMTAGRAFAVQSASMSQTLDSLQGAVRAGGGSVDETISGTVPRLRVRFRSGEEMAGFANRLRNQGWRVDETAMGTADGIGVADGSVPARGEVKRTLDPVAASAAQAAGASRVTPGDRTTSDVATARKPSRTAAVAPPAKDSPSSASARAPSAPASSAMPAAARPSPAPPAGGLSVSASSAFGAAPAPPTGGSVPPAPTPASRVYTVTAPDGGRIVLDARVEP